MKLCANAPWLHGNPAEGACKAHRGPRRLKLQASVVQRERECRVVGCASLAATMSLSYARQPAHVGLPHSKKAGRTETFRHVLRPQRTLPSVCKRCMGMQDATQRA